MITLLRAQWALYVGLIFVGLRLLRTLSPSPILIPHINSFRTSGWVPRPVSVTTWSLSAISGLFI